MTKEQRFKCVLMCVIMSFPQTNPEYKQLHDITLILYTTSCDTLVLMGGNGQTNAVTDIP